VVFGFIGFKVRSRAPAAAVADPTAAHEPEGIEG
jgi:hypothetical protein